MYYAIHNVYDRGHSMALYFQVSPLVTIVYPTRGDKQESPLCTIFRKRKAFGFEAG